MAQPGAAPTASTTAAPSGTQLSPSLSYSRILRPVTEVRSDLANWSDTELAALSVAVKAAGTQCVELQQTAYEGEELLALAHVCSLGQNWPGTYSAALRYARDPQQPHRVEAYSLLLQADLNLKQWRSVIEHLQGLHDAGPLSSPAAEIFAAAIRSMEVPATSYAVQAGLMLQPDLLRCTTACPGDLSPAQAEAMAWDTLTVLKENGDGLGEAAGDIAAAVGARTAPLPPEMEQDVASARARYNSLGHPVVASLPRPRCTPPDPTMVLPTVRGCQAPYVIMADDGTPDKPAFTKSVGQLRVRLADTLPVFFIRSGCKAATPSADGRNCPRTSVLPDLGATTALLLVATDARGNVAWNVSTTPSALQEGGLAEAIAYRVATPRGQQP